jgi:hypothetical protein
MSARLNLFLLDFGVRLGKAAIYFVTVSRDSLGRDIATA